MVQTPQVFDFGLLIEAHDSCPPDVTVTDDAALVERIGGAVKVFMGAYENLKVTHSGRYGRGGNILTGKPRPARCQWPGLG